MIESVWQNLERFSKEPTIVIRAEVDCNHSTFERNVAEKRKKDILLSERSLKTITDW